VADLGEQPRGPGPTLILGKKRRNNRRKESWQGKQNKTALPPLSSSSGYATVQ